MCKFLCGIQPDGTMNVLHVCDCVATVMSITATLRIRRIIYRFHLDFYTIDYDEYGFRLVYG